MTFALRDWMVLWLFVVKVSKAPESLLDGSPLAKHMQRKCSFSTPEQLELVTYVSQEPCQASDKPNDGDLGALKRQHSSPNPPGEKLETNTEEAGDHNHNGNRADTKQPLSGQRKAQIKQNVASNREEFDTMRAKGEPMRTWIDIIFQRKMMLEVYRNGIGRERTSSMLRKLTGIQLDINRVVRSRFRTWAGLGGRVFEPILQEKIVEISQKLSHRLTDDIESNVKVTDDLDRSPKVTDDLGSNQKVQFQPEISSLIDSPNPSTRQSCQERSGKPQQIMEEEVFEISGKSGDKKVEGQEKPTPQLTENELMIVYDKIMESSFSYLCHILQRESFHGWEEIPWRKYWEEIRVTKLTFERSILQMIQFMSKFELVKKGSLEIFLSRNETLDIIGVHLVDLFHTVKDGTYNERAFIPDMELLRCHWKTDYLHDIFGVLGKSQQANVLSAALTRTARLYQDFVIQDCETEWSKFIYNLVFQEYFFQRLESREPPVTSYSEDSNLEQFEQADLNVLGEKVIRFFQDPFFPNVQYPHPGKMKGLQAAYYLVYHILNYLITYHEEYLTSLFVGKESELYILQKELEIFRQGLKLFHVIQQGQTYREIISFKNNNLYTISKDHASTQLENAKRDYEGISESYNNLENDFMKISEINAKAKHWFDGYSCYSRNILLCFHFEATCWEEGIERERLRREYIRELQKKEKANECLPNLKEYFGAGIHHTGRDNSPLLNKELLNLWDPESFYL